MRYVALGDSYTIGTSVRETERWPNQLAEALRGGTRSLELVANLGVNGYTSADLIRDELPAVERLRPEFASVLIGVNDVVQGVPLEIYEHNAAAILDALLACLPADRLVTVSVPDHTVTPVRRRLRRSGPAARGHRGHERDDGSPDGRAHDRLCRHLRGVTRGLARPFARGR